MQLLHNPRCGKSRNCLAFLNDSNQEIEIINYLTNPLSESELETLIIKLKIKPIELVRQKEAIWIENFKGKTLSDKEVIKALSKYPILMERPIVIKGNHAVIGRDLQNVAEIIKKL